MKSMLSHIIHSHDTKKEKDAIPFPFFVFFNSLITPFPSTILRHFLQAFAQNNLWKIIDTISVIALKLSYYNRYMISIESRWKKNWWHRNKCLTSNAHKQISMFIQLKSKSLCFHQKPLDFLHIFFWYFRNPFLFDAACVF